MKYMVSCLLASGLLVAACGAPPPSQEEPAPAGEEPAGTPEPVENVLPVPGSENEPPLEVTLYFAGRNGRLRSETRDIRPGGTVTAQARRVVEALLKGPREDLIPTMPPDTTLREVYILEDGTAFVDLSTGFEQGLTQGSEQALLAVRSLINTMAANFSEVKRVQILVEGEEVRALGGHLDLSRPLMPDQYKPAVRRNL